MKLFTNFDAKLGFFYLSNDGLLHTLVLLFFFDAHCQIKKKTNHSIIHKLHVLGIIVCKRSPILQAKSEG